MSGTKANSQRRIVVVGTMGSGKTTMARQIAEHLRLPHIELDSWYWGADWTPTPSDVFRAQVREVLAGDAWVADGYYESARDIQWGRADTLVWLDYSPWLTLSRLLRRTAQRMLSRQTLWSGNRERLGNVISRDQFIFWVFENHRAKRREYPELLASPEFGHLTLVRLHSPREARRWLKGLRGSAERSCVLQLADYGGPYSGNFIASLHVLRQALGRRQCDQMLMLPGRAEEKPWFADVEKTEAPVRVIPEGASMWRALRAILAVAREAQPVIVHSHFSRYDIPAWLAAAILRYRGSTTQVIWHEHGGTLPPARTPPRLLKDFIKLRIMGRSAFSIAVSHALQSDLIARGMPPDRSFCVPNGIDLARALKRTRSRVEMRHALGVSDDAELLVLFGWDPYRKGVDIALKAAHELASTGEKFTLLLVGKRSLDDYVQLQLKDERPEWLRITRAIDDVGDFYGAADIFLAPSREEGLPYALVEAMVNEVPCVASSIPGHDWVGEDSVVRFTSESPHAMARAIQDVRSWSATERKRRTAAGRAMVEGMFSVEVWASALVDVYGTVAPAQLSGVAFQEAPTGVPG